MFKFHPDKKKIWEMFEFSMVGISGFLVLLGITWGLTSWVGISKDISYAIALVASLVYHFYLNMKVTFTALGNFWQMLERFSIVSAAILLLNWSGFWFLTNIFHIEYLWSIVIINTVLSLLNFEMEEIWVFKKLPESKHHRIKREIVEHVKKNIKKHAHLKLIRY